MKRMQMPGQAPCYGHDFACSLDQQSQAVQQHLAVPVAAAKPHHRCCCSMLPPVAALWGQQPNPAGPLPGTDGWHTQPSAPPRQALWLAPAGWPTPQPPPAPRFLSLGAAARP